CRIGVPPPPVSRRSTATSSPPCVSTGRRRLLSCCTGTSPGTTRRHRGSWLMPRTLWAVSDLHVTFVENQAVVDKLAPRHPGDWLIVAGDVAERIPDVVRTLGALKQQIGRASCRERGE